MPKNVDRGPIIEESKDNEGAKDLAVAMAERTSSPEDLQELTGGHQAVDQEEMERLRLEINTAKGGVVTGITII